MAPWSYLVSDLEKMQEQIARDPLSMREIDAMADYNLARSRNLFGSYKNAFDQRATARKVPGHMFPDYMTWLRTAQPAVATFLYGPEMLAAPLRAPPQPRERDLRTLGERRAVVLAKPVSSTAMPPVDEQGRIRHHHTYEQPPERSHRVQSGSLAARRANMIRPGRVVSRDEAAEEARRKRLAAAEARRG